MGAIGGSQGVPPSADINQSAIGNMMTAGAAGSSGVSGALCALNDTNAQDANESNILRRER